MEPNVSLSTNNSDHPAEHHASPGLMTHENTMRKIVIGFAVLLVAFPLGWIFPPLGLITLFAALIVGLVFTFKKKTVPGLVIAYAALEGYTLGAFTFIIESQHEGIALQAMLATLSIIAVVVGANTIPAVQAFAASKKWLRIILFAMAGYLLFSLANLGLMLTGVSDDPWGLRSSVTIAGIPLGLILGVFAVLMGAYCLLRDFHDIREDVKDGKPEKEGWRPAYGVILSVVWIYVEILRFIAILRA